MKSSLCFSRRDWFKTSAALALASPLGFQLRAAEPLRVAPNPLPGPEPLLFERVTLEMSLKPFRSVVEQDIRSVCAEIFRQWGPLIRRCHSVALMLWTADGSEILDYRGNVDDEIKWAKYIGIGHPPPGTGPADPKNPSLHEVPWLYAADAPRITYGTLCMIVRCLKEVGFAQTGKPVTVGATFDPGPEFAPSAFKYERHPEIAQGSTMGKGRWVACSAILKAEDRAYAGFPHGIREGTSLGTFLGGQSKHFLHDLGFDYLWLSNGFGFSLSSWDTKGVLFDGQRFDLTKARETRDTILRFWRDFRQACPDFTLETRGSNLMTGTDLATAGAPLRDIYRGGFHMIAPPNSPWAALDGDFGLELVGYLSRIAELPPDEKFPFRYYTHDPWWLNSPWFDRYGREPHDIYLPLATARLDRAGRVTRPAHLNLLTIDDSFGKLPEACPNEVTPHLLRAASDFSDEPGLVTWIYPFDENYDRVFGDAPRPAEPFLGDWLLRGAVNAGFPLNTVVSTGNFLASRQAQPELYRRTLLLAPAPDAGTPLESALLDSVATGHDVLLYGPLNHAGPRLLDALNLQFGTPLEGVLKLSTPLAGDTFRDGVVAQTLQHRTALSAGGVDTLVREPGASGFEVCATVGKDAESRAYAVFRKLTNGGRLAWLRGSFCNTVTGKLPTPDNPRKLFPAEWLLRWLLARFDTTWLFTKTAPETRAPLVLAARHANGLFLSGYCPSTAVKLRLRLPHGAPLLVGAEALLENGCATYVMPRAWHRECRCLVTQPTDGELSCGERHSGFVGIRRRLFVRGLKNADVHFLPELPGGKVIMAVNDNRPERINSIPYDVADGGRRLVARNLTGELQISW
jgi:hypothetical protein